MSLRPGSAVGHRPIDGPGLSSPTPETARRQSPLPGGDEATGRDEVLHRQRQGGLEPVLRSSRQSSLSSTLDSGPAASGAQGLPAPPLSATTRVLTVRSGARLLRNHHFASVGAGVPGSQLAVHDTIELPLVTRGAEWVRLERAQGGGGRGDETSALPADEEQAMPSGGCRYRLRPATVSARRQVAWPVEARGHAGIGAALQHSVSSRRRECPYAGSPWGRLDGETRLSARAGSASTPRA